MTTSSRLIAGLAAGCLTGAALVRGASFVARTLWPAYAAAEPEKADGLVMLLSRLGAGAICVSIGAWVATMIAKDDGKAGWWLGGIVLAISLPIHLYFEWKDFPVWYHLVYLSYLVPIAGLTGRFVSSGRSGEAELWR